MRASTARAGVFRGALILAALHAACAPDSPGTGEGANPPDSGAHAMAGTSPGDTAATPHIARRPELPPPYGGDLGRAILRFNWHEDRPREGTADTIAIRRAPDPASPVIARFTFTLGAPDGPVMAWGWSMHAAEPGLVANDVEYGYEENGVPVDSVAGDWARVVYAVTEAGERKMGWTRVDEETVVTRWADLFVEKNLFFIAPDSIAFHTSRGGPRAGIDLARAEGHQGFDYTMVPEEIAGAWMRVKLVTPSNYCFDPVSPAEHVVWVRFLDARGRPRVYYHSRGC